ncbi:GNAT family N-acetyltransferase [Williamwhitmania taraxaci]|uniref:Ribosomal-protein-alanine N-acetyltransferase n=1 Tax=Williamwhitmania taraxaci TaxID=1640674 RepID=A0A1G6MLJ7_9BACT|nr:GNAT family N-acetyltransferase [Williamwhitmania taraxaci]SDC56379.1 ribosomal-protein-alanine N-acetyltransferase [Williamwhitmania taraxaci]
MNATIFEFGAPHDIAFFESRLSGKAHYVIVAYADEFPVGYMIAYDRDSDGSFYCWMAGVTPEYRRSGIVSMLMSELERVAASKGYKWVTIKTRNNHRQMLSFLVKAGFNFTAVVERPATKDNRVLLEKRISR